MPQHRPVADRPFLFFLFPYSFLHQTSASYKPDTFPSFNLSNGALVPVSAAHYYTSDVESAGGVPTFTWSDVATAVNATAQIFCAVANTDPYGGGNPCPQLAIDTDASHFQLCENELGMNQVVHKPSAAGAEVYPKYDLTSCYPVNLHILDDSC